MKANSRPGWTKLSLVLSVIGLAIAGYLWSTKAGAPLVCGEFGDCVTVNTSEWSVFLGLPVAAWGAGMYLLLAVCTWAVWRNPASTFPALAGFAVALTGALFSLHLTIVEAFVLRAYCIWCLISWVIISVIAILWGRGLWQASQSTVSGKAARKQRRRV